MNLTEKAAYIKGLADGLDYDKTTKEGKILAALLDLVDEMAGAIAEIREEFACVPVTSRSLNLPQKLIFPA